MASGPGATELLLRILMRGVVDADSARKISAEAGLDAAALDHLIAAGALTDDEGFLYLTEAGDHRLTEDLHARLGPGEESSLAAFADEFSVLDVELKSAITAWQRAISEEDPDRQVEAAERWLDTDSRLREATERAQVPARVFGSCLARLESARQRVLDGHPDELSGPQDTSYHSVWFLLHEMLLRTLKREREG
jgi:hypothetical protein